MGRRGSRNEGGRRPAAADLDRVGVERLKSRRVADGKGGRREREEQRDGALEHGGGAADVVAEHEVEVLAVRGVDADEELAELRADGDLAGEDGAGGRVLRDVVDVRDVARLRVELHDRRLAVGRVEGHVVQVLVRPVKNEVVEEDARRGGVLKGESGGGGMR